MILLLGVRRAESIARAQRIDAYTAAEGQGRLNPHNDIRGCLIFRPIVDLTNDDVWHILLNDQREYFDAIQETTPVMALLVGGICLVLSVATWTFFRFRPGREA